MRPAVRRLLLVAASGILLLPLVACEDMQMVNWDSEYTEQWAPAIGSSLPLLSVQDTDGESKVFADLTGDQGLLIFFVRSTDW